MNEADDKTTMLGVVVDERLYKPDLEMLDRYQSYSAELLRLSLLTIAAMWFFVKGVAVDHYSAVVILFPAGVKRAFVVGMSFVLISAGMALAHRYSSSTVVAYRIRYARRSELPHDDKLAAQQRKCATEIRQRLMRSRFYLLMSAIALALGIVMMTATCAVMLNRLSREPSVLKSE